MISLYRKDHHHRECRVEIDRLSTLSLDNSVPRIPSCARADVVGLLFDSRRDSKEYDQCKDHLEWVACI